MKPSFKIIAKAVILAPIFFIQMICWLYLTINFVKIWVYSFMSWEQELDENWFIIQLVYFIWTNQLIKIFRDNQ